MVESTLLENFGTHVFHPKLMRERLPKPIFHAWEQAVKEQVPITKDVADSVAHAMKVWAMELGATHYCHWFQPLHGKTAEKHVAFLEPDKSGNPIARLSGNSLLKGETDGSSFPTGGLRDTFEATGITFWDVTAYAYVRGHTLYIPSFLISYHGDKLDYKLPLVRAQDALSKEGSRVLNLLGYKEVNGVRTMLGLEQEYFLVHQAQAMKRPDLQFCGRVLFSAEMPKAGEFEDTYFSRINEEVQTFMDEVNQECWSLGIYISVEHNEVAPGQYECSLIYTDVSTAVDQNMLLMDILESVAKRHNFLCLLHEKPFNGMNGSGKHNNISLIASNGDNLFDPGDNEEENWPFILFVAAFIEAVNHHQSLLYMASSDDGNDHRLGGNEAPPSIMSINLGAALEKLFLELYNSTEISPVELTKLVAPVVNLSEQRIDASDRNRTAPISFSGNRFELRTLGSSMNPAQVNTFLLTAIAQSLEKIGDQLEKAKRDSKEDLHNSVMEIAHSIVKENKDILFSGDCYTKEWLEEAKQRKLYHAENYIDSVEVLLEDSTIDLLTHFDILSKNELQAQYRILRKNYIHSLKMEGRILTRMAQEGVYPALLDYQIKLEQVALGGYSQSAKRRAEQNASFMDQIDSLTQELNALINRLVLEKDQDRMIQGMTKDLREKMNILAKLLEKVELNTPYGVFPYPSQDQLVVQ